MTDFRMVSYGSVASVIAVSPAAVEFAKENFAVEGWMGTAENFNTDWRVAFNLAEQLAGEGWQVDMP